MKNFIRTIAGKTILFITCILSLGILTASAVGAVLMFEFEVYTKSEEELFDELIEYEMRNDGYNILWNYLHNVENTDDSNSNLSFEVLDVDGKTLASSQNAKDGKWLPNHTYSYGVKNTVENGMEIYSYFEGDVKFENFTYYKVNFCLESDFPANDSYRLLYQVTHAVYELRYAVYAIAGVSLLLAIIAFISLMCVSARKPKTEQLCPGPLNRVPFDVMLAGAITLGISMLFLGDALFYEDFEIVIALIVGGIFYANLALGLCMSMAARIKQGTLLKNTVICYCLKLAARAIRSVGKVVKKTGACVLVLIRSIPLIWRTMLVVAGITFLEFLVIIFAWWEPDIFLVFWLLEKAILIPAVLYLAIILRRLAQAGDALAKGELDYQTETKGMFWDFKCHGENLNNIAKGMSLAVEDRLKSERMKTELITNVSHDIKTPLTSIINYATLIHKEPCENANVREYSAVLARQSERLKRLIEDLVEASKASTGNMEVELATCDVTVFLTQAGGEYAEKLERAGLTLVTKQPETPVKIMADGRRMWRIFDNLMNNICKYAQSGTRVYLSLETVAGHAVISFKNISRDSLDMTEEELMERFVRGDASRNTEGNGLGLSIAKSLAELQNGSLRLEMDGDLFKAILTFPMV